ncbi:hypothetical protein DFH28DRAFT_921424 [Melampsora americana]|nr:hypothetical protein DFH28DRAFT_921424 [Melampsora americana]
MTMITRMKKLPAQSQGCSDHEKCRKTHARKVACNRAADMKHDILARLYHAGPVAPINLRGTEQGSVKPFRQELWAECIHLLYGFVQFIISQIFVVKFTKTKVEKPLGRVAIIGAGVTGVSSAAHLISHGFEVVIYEQKPKLGGIWAAVNQTSSLQLNSLLYRFHPAVIWSQGFPVKQHEILSEITRIWELYHLESRTKFNYTVRNVSRKILTGGKTQWTIDEGQDGVFDAVIVAIGTCGPPKAIQGLGIDRFTGPVAHSSKLDGLDLKGKRVVIIGGGASGVEAAELAVNSDAAEVSLLARSDKWFIPRNWFLSILLGCCPRIFQDSVGALVERALVKFHYGNLKHLAPARKRFYADTPIVNDIFFRHVRSGRARYIRGDLLEILPRALKLNERTDRTSKPGDRGFKELLKADVIIDSSYFLAKTTLHPISLCKPFSVSDPTCLMTNAAYFDGVGAVGHYHIATEMINWVDQHRGLECFTYCELIWWFLSFHLTNVRRMRWAIFNLFGLNTRRLPLASTVDHMVKEMK